MTLHSFAGLGVAPKFHPKFAAKRVAGNAKASERWRNTKILIVDEISMVDGDYLDSLEEAAREIRHHNGPFGGIQVGSTRVQEPSIHHSIGRVLRRLLSTATRRRERKRSSILLRIKMLELVDYKDHSINQGIRLVAGRIDGVLIP